MKLLMNQQATLRQVRAPKNESITLIRRGAWLHASEGSWQMHSVVGPLEADHLEGSLKANREGREYFHVTTASKQKLVVSRAAGDRGMRELRLERVLVADPEPLFAVLLSA